MEPMKTLHVLLLLPLLASCATSKAPWPGVIESAERAIEAAERAGAEELSPVELRFARERLDLARLAIEKGKNVEAGYAIEQSEINSELAIEQSRTALERRKVNEMQRANEVLREELSQTYGDAWR
jgi:hypothetical protein